MMQSRAPQSAPVNSKVQREQEFMQKLTPDPNVGEKVLFTGLAVLQKVIDEKDYQKYGTGMAQILQNNENKRCRILVRKSTDLNEPLLNSYILPSFKLFTFKSDPNSVRFDAINYAETIQLETFLVKFISPEACEKFRASYIDSIQNNDILLKQLNR